MLYPMNDLVTYLLPLLPAAGKILSGVVTERVPRDVRQYVPLALGAAAGYVAHRYGLSPQMCALVFGAAGPGAVAWHRFTKKGGTITQIPAGSGRTVSPADLPPK